VSDSHYELLGVEPDASKDEIRDAYRGRLEELKVQAENGKSDQQREAARRETKELNSAWQVLSDPFQRQRYDDALGVEGGEVELVDDAEGDADDDAGEARPPARGLRRFLEPQPRAGGKQPARARERKPPEGVSGAEAAPLGRRLAAMGIDLAIVGALYLGIANLAAAIFDPDDEPAQFIALFITTIFIVFVVYFAVMTARTGQTVGKRLVHVMVVDAETGQLPTMRRAGLRYLVPVVLLLGLPGQLGALLALLFGFSWALVDTRVGLMDRLGRTRVVVARYRPERAAQ
jgi:uncharacterized RDD family membrane protein YckC